MPIDYSKWDRIELSDDSDIEVHPNVDKRSFIRWKQQSIHEQRAKRNQDIKNLEFQLEMYSRLNKRVDKLLNQLSDEELVDMNVVTKFLNANFDKTEKGSGDNVDPDLPPYNEMVEDLFDQLVKDAESQHIDPKDGKVIKRLLLEHRAKIDKVSKEADEKLLELYKERNKLISSDDIHTGFERSFINAGGSSNPSYLPVASTQSSDVKLPPPPLQFIEYKDDIMKLAPETEKFGNILVNNYKESEAFLLNHLPIISEQQKDALMMKAFDYQAQGEEDKTYQIIHQSELLAYVREIYNMKKLTCLNPSELSGSIKMFFQRVFYNSTNIQGRASFLESVQAKFAHVKNRVKIMEQERLDDEHEGVETIQLKSLDDSTELQVNLPDFLSSSPDEQRKVQAFNKLPVEMQNAVKMQNLDKINEVFANIPIDEAEKILEILNEGEIIGINALLEDEDHFKELQEQYYNEKNIENLTIEES